MSKRRYSPPSVQPRETIAAIVIRKGGAIELGGVPVIGLPDFVWTSSSGFEILSGMSLHFKLDRKSPVQVLFHGQLEGVESTAKACDIFRLTIDGIIVDSAIAVGHDHGTNLPTFGFNACSSPLEPGGHRAKVLWHKLPSEERTCVGDRSLAVLLPPT